MKPSCGQNSCKLPQKKIAAANVKVFKIAALILAALAVITGFVSPYQSAKVFFHENYPSYGCFFKDNGYIFIIGTYALLGIVIYYVLSRCRKTNEFVIYLFGFFVHYMRLTIETSQYFYHIDSLMGVGLFIVAYAYFPFLFAFGCIVGWVVTKLPAYKKWRDDFESVYLPENLKS